MNIVLNITLLESRSHAHIRPQYLFPESCFSLMALMEILLLYGIKVHARNMKFDFTIPGANWRLFFFFTLFMWLWELISSMLELFYVEISCSLSFFKFKFSDEQQLK